MDYLKEIKKVQHEAENLSRELENTKTELLHAVETNASKQVCFVDEFYLSEIFLFMGTKKACKMEFYNISLIHMIR